SLIWLTSLPLSNTKVFSPFSVNSLAAHPPLMPDPMTIASKVLSFILSIFKLAIDIDFFGWIDLYLSLKTARNHLVGHDLCHKILRTQIALKGKPFGGVQKILQFLHFPVPIFRVNDGHKAPLCGFLIHFTETAAKVLLDILIEIF